MLIVGPVRIDAVVATLSVSSLARLLVLLVASVAVRHLTWSRPPLHLRFLAAVCALSGSAALRRVLPPFLATRGAVLFTGMLAVLTIGFPDGDPPVRIAESEVANLPLRWDAGWYLDIAVHGYRWSPEDNGQQNVAFFPAYPALMSLGAALVNAGNEPEGLGARLSYERYYVRHIAAGLFIALGAFLWGLAYVYRLAREDLDDRSATSAILLLCVFPFAVFYGAPYSENLFLLATVAAFFHGRRGEWAAACAWGALAGLTRPNGFALRVPLALLALQARARSPRAWLAVAAPLGGLAAFSLYLLAQPGNPFAWLEAHAAWGRSTGDMDMLLAVPPEFRSGVTRRNPVQQDAGRAVTLARRLRGDPGAGAGRAADTPAGMGLRLVGRRQSGAGDRFGRVALGRARRLDAVSAVHLPGRTAHPRAVRAGGGGVRHAAGVRSGAVLYMAAGPVARRPSIRASRRSAACRRAETDPPGHDQRLREHVQRDLRVALPAPDEDDRPRPLRPRRCSMSAHRRRVPGVFAKARELQGAFASDEREATEPAPAAAPNDALGAATARAPVDIAVAAGSARARVAGRAVAERADGFGGNSRRTDDAEGGRIRSACSRSTNRFSSWRRTVRRGERDPAAEVRSRARGAQALPHARGSQHRAGM